MAAPRPPPPAALSPAADYARASEQYAWLLRDLAAVDRSRTPWLLVVMHAPWSNSNYAHQVRLWAEQGAGWLGVSAVVGCCGVPYWHSARCCSARGWRVPHALELLR